MERMTPDTTDFNSLSKKQLVELVIAKYNDCFRLEGENKKLKEECEENDYLVEDNARWMKKCEEKTMEIKKLKEENRFLTKISKEYMEKENIIEITEFTELYKDDLEEENRKLKEDVDYRYHRCMVAERGGEDED